MNVIKALNIKKQFGDVEVLKNISLEVNKGEVLSIIGPSGSGKSTLLRCLTQLERNDSGEITVCGQKMVHTENNKAVYAPPAELVKMRLETGLVFQSFNLFPHFSVLRNVTEALVHVLKMPQKEAKDRVDRFLKMLSDKRRIDIIKMLSYKPYYGYEIAAKLELTPATVNYHISLLMDADVLTFDREENKVYYTLNKEKIKELLKETSIVLLNEPL
jgi:ABC-type histidine transport system ATPase subunit